MRMDNKHNAADLSRSAQAAPRCGGEELAADTLALATQVCSNAREPEPGHIVPGEAAANRVRRVSVGQSAWSQAVETKNALVVCVINCEKGLRGTRFMALASVTLEEIIHGRITTIETLPIMLFRDWLFVPGGSAHRRFRPGFGIRAMASPSLAFGVGGFSTRFR